MCSILSELIRQERLVVVEEFTIDAPKTKGLLARLAELSLSSVLIVTENVDENLYLSARNLKDVDVLDVAATNPVSLLSHEKVLITVAALKQFEAQLAAVAVNEEEAA